MVFVCHIDGTQVGEFPEPEFHKKVMAGEFGADDHYWHEGMSDWRPISDYRPLAKTQRISFAPPPRPTVQIKTASAEGMQNAAKRKLSLGHLLDRLRRRKP